MAEKTSLWNTEIMGQALVDSVRKLDPRGMIKNPVMFVVEVGSVLTTALLTDNTKDFPAQWMAERGIELLTAGQLLTRLTDDFPDKMRQPTRRPCATPPSPRPTS